MVKAIRGSVCGGVWRCFWCEHFAASTESCAVWPTCHASFPPPPAAPDLDPPFFQIQPACTTRNDKAADTAGASEVAGSLHHLQLRRPDTRGPGRAPATGMRQHLDVVGLANVRQVLAVGSEMRSSRELQTTLAVTLS